jgi:hypothetical protein
MHAQGSAPYLASIAVTSTSIAMLGHANWLTTRNVEAGIGALACQAVGRYRRQFVVERSFRQLSLTGRLARESSPVHHPVPPFQ